MSDYLTSADAARLLELTPAAIRQAAKQGRIGIAAMTEGGQRLFSRTEVERFRRQREKRLRQAAR